MSEEKPKGDFKECVERAAAALNADILLYTGPIARPHDDSVIEGICGRRRRKNVVLVLGTAGGSPDAAYRIARCLRRHYEKVTAFVPAFCKSAGTLLILGANEIVMTEHAELGPLDVQLWKEDGLGDYSSGLAPSQAIRWLNNNIESDLEELLIRLKENLGLSAKTTAEMSSRLISSLYGNIYAQLDPMRLGEIQRAQQIALHYGKRLLAKSGIADENLLMQLVAGYPSHGFVVDIDEAQDLFAEGKVRGPNASEKELEPFVRNLMQAQCQLDRRTKTVTCILNRETDDAHEEEHRQANGEATLIVGDDRAATA